MASPKKKWLRMKAREDAKRAPAAVVVETAPAPAKEAPAEKPSRRSLRRSRSTKL